MPQISILFVCLGNICRSPMAEGILRHLAEKAGRADEFLIDSAGTGAWHIGDPPDSRAIAVAADHDIDISGLRARKVAPADFDRFDLILALDHDNLLSLRESAPSGATARIALFSEHAFATAQDVPDPYFGGRAEFDAVYRMLYRGCASIAGSPKEEPPSYNGNTSSVT